MSVGNLKDNGNKGNNFPYQINVLKLLGLIGGSTSASATEATLLQVLAAIQSGQEYEQNLVIDKGAPGEPTYKLEFGIQLIMFSYLLCIILLQVVS